MRVPVLDNHGGKIAIAAFVTLTVAAAVLLPMTLIKTNLRDAMQGWMNHPLSGAGRRWHWIVGGAAGAVALGTAGLVFREPGKPVSRPAAQTTQPPVGLALCEPLPVAVILPPGWRQVTDRNGTYYWNDETQQSEWFKEDIPGYVQPN